MNIDPNLPEPFLDANVIFIYSLYFFSLTMIFAVVFHLSQATHILFLTNTHTHSLADFNAIEKFSSA